METAIQIIALLFMFDQFFTIRSLKNENKTLKIDKKFLEDKAERYRRLWMKACGNETKD